ncbi:6127_t:CDS:1, partial [Cetraspora pellucida]
MPRLIKRLKQMNNLSRKQGCFESQNKVQEITNIQEKPALTVQKVNEAI